MVEIEIFVVSLQFCYLVMRLFWTISIRPLMDSVEVALDIAPVLNTRLPKLSKSCSIFVLIQLMLMNHWYVMQDMFGFVGVENKLTKKLLKPIPPVGT